MHNIQATPEHKGQNQNRLLQLGCVQGGGAPGSKALASLELNQSENSYEQMMHTI